MLCSPNSPVFDMASVALFAHRNKAPVFFTDADGRLTDGVADALRGSFSHVLVAAQEAQISEETVHEVEALLADFGEGMQVQRLAGIDDLRPFCAIHYPEKQSIPIYANRQTADALRVTMPYCFGEHLYPGVPLLDLKTIQPHVPFRVGDFEIVPFVVMHHDLPILAFRIGKLVYITDMKSIDDAEVPYAEDAELLVVNALRWHRPHHSHQTVEEAVAFARRVRAKRTLLIHGSHEVGLHRETNALLPPDIQLAYDGLQLTLP